MSYANKLDEINEKLIKLQSSGGVTRPLMPVDSFGGASAQIKKLEQIEELLLQLKNRPDALGVLGKPTDAGKRRAGYILDNIVKQSTVDTLNALYDFYDRFKNTDITVEDADRFNKLICEVLSGECTAAQLVRLSDKTKLPLKKRQRISKLAAVLSQVDSGNAAKRLPELLIIKNEIEGYLNEKQNERDCQALVKNTGREDFEQSLEKFCMIELSDILEPPVLAENHISGENGTVFGLLEAALTDLFMMRSEMDEFRLKITADINELAQGIKTLSLPDTKPSAELKIENKYGEGDKTYGSILDELSALKDDIKSALTFDKD